MGDKRREKNLQDKPWKIKGNEKVAKEKQPSEHKYETAKEKQQGERKSRKRKNNNVNRKMQKQKKSNKVNGKMLITIFQLSIRFP